MHTGLLAHNFDKLRHFLWVYEAGSFLSAAKSHGIGQPQLSRSIKALELDLEVELFKRSSSGLTATAHALKLYHLCLKVFGELNDYENTLSKDKASNLKGHLSLGTYSSISRYLLPKFFDFFDVIHPELDLTLEIGRSREIERLVSEGQLDLGIVVGQIENEKLSTVLLYEDEFSFYSSSQLKPERQSQVIIYEQVAHEIKNLKPLLKDKQIRKINVDSFELAYQLVCESLGVALLPNRVAEQAVNKHILVKTKFKTMPVQFHRHQIFLIYKKPTKAILDFESSLKEFLGLYF